MDPIVGTRRVERPGYAWIAAGLQVVVGLAAIPIGLQLMAEAEGAPLGLPQAWIDATPVRLVAGARAVPVRDERHRPAGRRCADRRPPPAGAVADRRARRGPDDLDRGPGGADAGSRPPADHVHDRRPSRASSPCSGSGDWATSAACGLRRGSDDDRRAGHPGRHPAAALPRGPGDRRRLRGRRLDRDATVRGRLRVSDHAVDDDGRGLPGGGRRRADQPVGDAAAVHRARVGALVRVGGRGRCAGRRPGHELHRGPGPDPHEGGPVRHLRQAPAGRLPHRRPGAHQPGAQHPRRPRRRHGRRRHGLGDPVRAQRAGGRRTSAPSPGASPRRPRCRSSSSRTGS